MKKYAVARAFLLCLVLGFSEPREITTHEDIKDAMLSLVHVMRENTDKLDRHEARGKNSGEQTRKAIALLTKRVSTMEGLKVLEERIANIEQIIIQKDERERIQLEKLTEAMKTMENRLMSRVSDVESIVLEAKERSRQAKGDDYSETLVKIDNQLSQLVSKVEKLEPQFAVFQEISKEAAKQSSKIHIIFNGVNDVEEMIRNMESSLQKLEEKSEEQGRNDSPNLSVTVEEQNRALARVATLLEETSDRVRQLADTKHVQSLHNNTLESLQETRHILEDLVMKQVETVRDGIFQSRNERRELMEGMRSQLSNDVKKVNQQVHDLEKGQSVMVSMADHVLDTKKRVEYGVHQILTEVGDLVRSHGASINATLNSRFDGMSTDILDNQNGALANLTTKMEQEMSQVWRQINAMYQQMMESAKALERLHEQSEAYVAGTTSTMGGMENKVGEITKRMMEVDENLNFLLGRLSLVTQEFNHIKISLSTTLDNIKTSFKEVQDKANDLSPGPHPVLENHVDDIYPSSTQSPPEIVTHA